MDPESADIPESTSIASAHASGTRALELDVADCELVRAEDESPDETIRLPESLDVADADSSAEPTTELARIDELISELKRRHQMEIRTVLIALFAFVAFASFFLCFFLARFNLQPAAQDSAPAPSSVPSPEPPRPVSNGEGGLAPEKASPGAVGKLANGSEATVLPQANATVLVPGLASGASINPASPASKAAGESSAAAPGVAHKPPSFKTRQAARNYGI
jgi:hypothetical protein